MRERRLIEHELEYYRNSDRDYGLEETRLFLEVALDTRDQNARIIELLETNRNEAVKPINLTSLSNEQWGVLRSWVRIAASETVTEIMRKAQTDA